MLKTAIIFAAGFSTAVAAIATPIIMSDSIAAVVSQRIYDCGLRVASGMDGIKINFPKGVTASSRRWLVCLDSPATLAGEK